MSIEGTDWQVERIVSITDGDTVRLVRSRTFDIDSQLEATVRDRNPKGVSIRLVWLDTPERGDPRYQEARNDLSTWLVDRIGTPLTVICYESAGWDRTLGDLVDADGNSASQWLMTERHWPAYVKGQ